MMTDNLVLYESKESIATITINRPAQLNALSGPVVAGLKEAFIRYDRSEDRCAIVTGAGEKAFTAGADLRDPPRDPELWECMPGVGVDVDKPIVAAVAGYCVGGGIVLAQFCDIAVAAENADFFYPEAQVGFCGGLIAGLAARVPHKIAMEIMLTGKHFNAHRAYEVGLVNQVTPNGKHLEGALEYAKILRDSAPLVISMLKRFIRNAVLPKGPSEQSGIARRDLLTVSNSQDQQEGGRAFREKRKPVFTGK